MRFDGCVSGASDLSNAIILKVVPVTLPLGRRCDSLFLSPLEMRMVQPISEADGQELRWSLLQKSDYILCLQGSLDVFAWDVAISSTSRKHFKPCEGF